MKHFTKILTAFSLTSFLFAQWETLAVGGNVTDLTTGKPIIGANIIVDGTNISTTTDSNGSYHLYDAARIGVDTTVTVSMSKYLSITKKVYVYAHMPEPYFNLNFSMTLLKDVITKPKLVGIDMNTLVRKKRWIILRTWG